MRSSLADLLGSGGLQAAVDIAYLRPGDLRRVLDGHCGHNWLSPHRPALRQDVLVPRLDVIAALETLSDVESHERWARGESTWPDLDSAIHWLIDDTWLDLQPTGSVDPTLFQSERETRLVKIAVDSLCAVIDDVGDVDVTAYVTHVGWSSVVADCARALAAMTRSDA